MLRAKPKFCCPDIMSLSKPLPPKGTIDKECCDNLEVVSKTIAEGLRAALAAQESKSIFKTHDGDTTIATSSLVTTDRKAKSVSVPSRSEILGILVDEHEALLFLEEKKVLQPAKNCPHCCAELIPSSRSLKSKSRFVLRCRKRRCEGHSCSVLAGSVLQTCRFSKAKFVDFVCHWLLGGKAETIRTSLAVSPKTVADWSNCLRETVAFDLLVNSDCQIGGPGIVVEIDESKFGKRKHHVSVLCARDGPEQLFSP